MTLKKGGGKSALGTAQIRSKIIRKGMKGYMSPVRVAELVRKLGLPGAGRVQKPVRNLKFPKANKFASLSSLGNRRGISVSPGSIVLYNSETAKRRSTMAKILARKQKHRSNSYRASGPTMYSAQRGSFTTDAPASVGVLLPNKPPSFLQKALSRVKATGHHVGSRLGSVFFRSAARSGKKKTETEYLRRIHDIEEQMRNIAKRKASAHGNNKEALGDLLKRLDVAVQASKRQWNRGNKNSQINLLDSLKRYMKAIIRGKKEITIYELNARIKATKNVLKRPLSPNHRSVFGEILRHDMAMRRKLQSMLPVGRLM
jgi:hypothetical protein